MRANRMHGDRNTMPMRRRRYIDTCTSLLASFNSNWLNNREQSRPREKLNAAMSIRWKGIISPPLILCRFLLEAKPLQVPAYLQLL